MARRHPDSGPTDWRRQLTQYIAENPQRPQKLRALARALHIPDATYADFRSLVRDMLAAGELVLGPARTLQLPQTAGALIGVYRSHPRGFGFIESPGQRDMFVPPGRSGGARDGDLVNARLLKRRDSDVGPSAEVTRVVRRAEIRWVGELERIGAEWFVRVQGKAAGTVVRVDDPGAKSAQAGDLVAVEPLPHTEDGHQVRGVIIERLGDPGELRVQIRGVIHRRGIPEEFEPAIRQMAGAAAERFDERSYADREDLRELVTITIDPPDARDFDDAISITSLPNGAFELGVHIADVSHFVELNDLLDHEARRRGNSTYFPGYVVPMLPEVLSNGVCSLVPGEPRLTKSAFIRYDPRARVMATRFANSVIQSHARFHYEEVSALLQQQHPTIPPDLMRLLRDAEALARRIRERRLANGMIVLNLPSLEIRLSEDRREVVNAGPADASFSHTIIEMFMVEANEAVCRVLAQARLEPLRRLHPEPAPEAGASLARLLRPLGIRAPRLLTRESILELLKTVNGSPAESSIHLALLRCLPRAYYSPKSGGHFALASEDYCHFTSPIRRYPDLVIHRQLDLLLKGKQRKRNRQSEALDSGELVEIGRSCSLTERRSQDAERDIQQICLLQIMQGRIGETFDGVITGVTAFGAFVQIQPVLADGLVRVSDFGRDQWAYVNDSACFVGRRSGRVIHFGQIVRVRVTGVDHVRQELLLTPVGSDGFGELPPRTMPPPNRRSRSRVSNPRPRRRR